MFVTIGGNSPQVGTGVWVAPNASLIGHVAVGDGSSIWYGAVIRADNDSIRIGRRSNVQDNCVLHVDDGRPIVVGDDVSIGHGAVIHGATIEDGVLIGMGAIIMNGAVVGTDSLIAAGALVPEGAVIPSRSMVAGVPGKIRRELTEAEIAAQASNAGIYQRLSVLHQVANA